MKNESTDPKTDERMKQALAKTKKQMEAVNETEEPPSGVYAGPKNKAQLDAMLAEFKTEEEREIEEEEENGKD